MGDPLPRCDKFECANNDHNHCLVLTTSDFKGKQCPFYKTRGQARKEIAECNERKCALKLAAAKEAAKNEKKEK